jgi:hypothetical protein
MTIERMIVFATSVSLFVCGVLAGAEWSAGRPAGAALGGVGALTCLAVLVAVVRSAADAEAAYRKLAAQCRAEYAAMQAGHDAELAKLAADARAHMDYLRAAKAKLSEPAEGDEWKAGGP